MTKIMQLQKQLNGDVWYIRDGVRVGVNPWSSKPVRRNKYIMYNCMRYRAEWLPAVFV